MADSLVSELPLPQRRDDPEASEPDRQNIDLRKRLTNPKTILSFVVAALLLFTVFRKLGDFSQAAQIIKGVNPWMYGLAFVAYALTFPARGLRWNQLLRNVGERQPAGEMTQYLFLSWFVNCLVPAKIGDVYRAYLVKKNDGIAVSKSMGTIFAERIIDTLIIFAAFGVAGYFVFNENLPPQIRIYILAGVILAVICAVVLLFMRHFGERVVTRFASPRIAEHYRRFEQGTLGSFKNLHIVLFFTLAAWLFEALRLFIVAQALGAGSTSLGHFQTAVFAMVTSSILTLVPTPGGLGAVEGGVTGVLILAGLTPGMALAVTIMDRIVSYWALILTGAIDYFASKRAH